MEYQIAPKKKVKTRPYSILIQNSKGSSAFDEQNVKNIAIEYRLASVAYAGGPPMRAPPPQAFFDSCQKPVSLRYC